MPTRLRPLNNWVVIQLDPLSKENISEGGIVLLEPEMVRTGTVLRVGPGKTYKDKKRISTQLKGGERVAFFTGNMDTKQGQALKAHVSDDEAFITEDAILFTLDLEEGEKPPRITR